MFAAITILLVFVALLYAERMLLARRRKHFSPRILVNGTRGKSSVTEYIAAAMRHSGKKTFAKITGIIPTVFLPDGSERVIKRRGPARVQEQSRMIFEAAAAEADSVVLECMSINPEYQLIETRILQPDIYVITNIGDDHREEMGETIEERINAICGAIPENGIVITVNDENFVKVKEHAEARNAVIRAAGNYVDENSVPPGVFSANINIACEAMSALGLGNVDTPNQLLQYVKGRPGSVTECSVNTNRIFFINGFPVNDTPSAEKFTAYWKSRLAKENLHDILYIFNTRTDRPKRTRLFCEWFASGIEFSKLIITGNHKHKAYNLLKGKIPENKLALSEMINNTAQLKKLLSETINRNSLVFGIGNIAGEGFTIIDCVRQLAEEGNNNDN